MSHLQQHIGFEEYRLSVAASNQMMFKGFPVRDMNNDELKAVICQLFECKADLDQIPSDYEPMHIHEDQVHDFRRILYEDNPNTP
jgi:hypothetical protein